MSLKIIFLDNFDIAPTRLNLRRLAQIKVLRTIKNTVNTKSKVLLINSQFSFRISDQFKMRIN